MSIKTNSGCWIPEARPWNGFEAGLLRSEMKLSQAAFGELFGKTERTVRRWEKKGAAYKFTALVDRLMLDTLHESMAAARRTR